MEGFQIRGIAERFFISSGGEQTEPQKTQPQPSLPLLASAVSPFLPFLSSIRSVTPKRELKVKEHFFLHLKVCSFPFVPQVDLHNFLGLYEYV